jgi:phage terminase large subunit GpA-like protein
LPELVTYQPQFQKMFRRSPQLSNIKPSVWAAQNIMIPNKGRLNYDYNPYCKEIIDRMAPDDPARKIAVMKGSQITFSSGVVIPVLGYIIKEDPHNTYYMVGTPELVTMAVEKLDYMIHGAKLQDYIGYQIKRKKNNKSGDTDEIKSFANGYIKIGSATNPKSIAQVDLERIILDDYDAMQGNSKVAGNFQDLIEMRAAASKNTYKLIMISTPLLKATSNIEPAFLHGDQRRYFLECPCCHEPIIIKWEVKEGDMINQLTNELATCNGGIVYGYDNHGRVDKKTVGYVCYKCGGWFDDRNKQNMLRGGLWKPTAVSKGGDDYFSYHIPSLCAPVGMFGWYEYAKKWEEAHPKGQPRVEKKYQTLVNTCFGETYDGVTEELEIISLMKNKRNYDVGMVPDKQSMEDGNGRIIMLTCASDMNGKIKGVNSMDVDDARLDFEILAHSESGATYSILHGSIGTFVPREGDNGKDRKKWTYEHNKPNSVWPEFEKVLTAWYETDTGRKMKIGITGLDCGFGAKIGAYPFLDKTNVQNVVGLKGKKEDKYMRADHDAKLFAKSLERPSDMYMLEVGVIKDRLAEYMGLRWDKAEPQPPFFMNFPRSSKGLYELENYFEHFKSEKRALVDDGEGNKLYRWEKVNTAVQNHMWDCRVYNIVLREIFLARLAEQHKVKNLTWAEFVEQAKKVIV